MENREVSCPCRHVKCKRHGDCEACRAHHRTKADPRTACEKQREKGPVQTGE